MGVAGVVGCRRSCGVFLSIIICILYATIPHSDVGKLVDDLCLTVAGD